MGRISKGREGMEGEWKGTKGGGLNRASILSPAFYCGSDLIPDLCGSPRKDGQCCGRVANQNKLDNDYSPRPCADTCTCLRGYGLSIGPTEGLSLWWLIYCSSSQSVVSFSDPSNQ